MAVHPRTAVAALALVTSLSGCSFAIGGGTAAVVIAAGVFASACYDHVDVTVRDQRGAPICDAEVVAIRGEDEEVDVMPCYSAALTAGTWRIVARRGQLVANTTLVIPVERDCGRVVQRIDLTLAQAPTSSVTAKAMRSSGTTSSTTPISTAALGMP